MTRVRMFDYLAQYGDLRAEVHSAIDRVLASGVLIQGPEGEAFEHAFAEFLGGGGKCIGVNSGTDALVIALRALGVGAGDEVVTVANTAVPTVSAIREAGATPVFCDVVEDTCLMDLAALEDCLSPATRAVIPVHLFGNAVDVDQLRAIIDDRPIKIVEDCAQAVGTRLDGRRVGTLGDVSAFSFYPTKNLGAYGDAGCCYTRDEDLARRIRSLRMYGFEGSHYAEREGQNSRLDELQAAILRVKLPHVDSWVESRQRLAARYEARLSSKVGRLRTASNVEHAYHLFVVRSSERDPLRERLAHEGVDTGIHYAHPIHLMRGFGALGHQPGSLPVTEQLAEEILSLPMYPELSDESVDRVCAAIDRLA